MTLTKVQLHTLALVERSASVISILGVLSIISIFCFSSQFRNPIHRVVFINAFYNVLDVTATMISLSGPDAGNNSALCQFQGFLMQMFPLADVLWTLAMALDVFLIVFYKYEARDLHRLEKRFIAAITTFTFIPALVFLFIRTPQKGRMYGSVTLWCAISPHWVMYRIVFYYVPIWLSIVVIIALYSLVGLEILKQRRLRKSTDEEYINNAAVLPNDLSATNSCDLDFIEIEMEVPSPPVPIAKLKDGKESEFTSISESTSQHLAPRRTTSSRKLHTRSTVSFRQYVFMPLMFFVILLMVWVAPTVNRVSTFIHPSYVNYPLLLCVGAFGSLRGFWNGVVFVILGMKERKRMKQLKQTYR